MVNLLISSHFYQMDVLLSVTYLSSPSLNYSLTLTTNISLLSYQNVIGPSNIEPMTSSLLLQTLSLSSVY